MSKTIKYNIPKIGRNDYCPCGELNENGKFKKFKHCCKDMFGLNEKLNKLKSEAAKKDE